VGTLVDVVMPSPPETEPPETERPSSCHRQRRGRPQGMSSPPETEPHPTHHHPRPYGDEATFHVCLKKPTRERRPLHPPLDAINRVPTASTRFPYLKCIGRKSCPYGVFRCRCQRWGGCPDHPLSKLYIPELGVVKRCITGHVFRTP
jgi:hypothetical protein